MKNFPISALFLPGLFSSSLLALALLASCASPSGGGSTSSGASGGTGAGQTPAVKKVALSPEMQRAQKLYIKRKCARCHGKEGRGDGPEAKDMSPKPTDLRDASAYEQGKDLKSIMETIYNGVPYTDMDPDHTIPVPERRAIARYVLYILKTAPPSIKKKKKS